MRAVVALPRAAIAPVRAVIALGRAVVALARGTPAPAGGVLMLCRWYRGVRSEGRTRGVSIALFVLLVLLGGRVAEGGEVPRIGSWVVCEEKASFADALKPV